MLLLVLGGSSERYYFFGEFSVTFLGLLPRVSCLTPVFERHPMHHASNSSGHTTTKADGRHRITPVRLKRRYPGVFFLWPQTKNGGKPSALKP
jgi:hypothetical protein